VASQDWFDKDFYAVLGVSKDVTPADLIAAIVTEEGVHRAPYAVSLPAPVRSR